MADSVGIFSHQRVESLDALRGFDMFWIMGAESLVSGLRRLTDSPAILVLADQMEHAPWQGFRCYDLIFPLFVFLMGASTVFSLSRFKEQKRAFAAYPRLFPRFILLYLLGLFYYGGMAVFFQLIDVWGAKTWSRPFVCIGMNSIAVYMLANLIGSFDSVARRIIHHSAEDAMGPWGGIAVATLGLTLAILFCRYLYRQRIFIRV